MREGSLTAPTSSSPVALPEKRTHPHYIKCQTVVKHSRGLFGLYGRIWGFRRILGQIFEFETQIGLDLKESSLLDLCGQ